ncbi:MAG: XRE family transcriptional regulator [Acidobacteriaceae bacterium]|jgi:predicted XRE-type DNA-binding protein
MKRKTNSDDKTPHVTRGSVLGELGFGASETLEIKVKVEVYRELLKYIHERGYSQKELGGVLGIHQPDTSNLLNGRVSKFSVGKLIKFAGKLNLGAQIRLTKPKPIRSVAVSGTRRRAAA